MIWLGLLIIMIKMYIFYYKQDWQPRRPSFLLKRKLLKIGHRGAPLLAHENTLDSFVKSIEAGVDGVEFDVQFSADKQLIIYHNWTLNTLIIAEELGLTSDNVDNYLESEKWSFKQVWGVCNVR